MSNHLSSKHPVPDPLLWSARVQTLSNWLLHILLFLTPFLFSFATNELFEFNKMIFVYGITTAVIGCWIARSVLEKKLLLTPTSLDLAMYLFVGSQIISTAISVHLPTSIFGYYSRFHGGLLSTLSYVGLFYVLTNTVTKKQLTTLFITLLISASLVSLYAIPEKFHFSPSCWFLNQAVTTDCWSESTNPKYRIFGTFGQPNWLAAYAVTVIPIALFFTLDQTKKRWLRMLGLFSSSVLFLALLFTQSRSGILGLTAGLVVLGAVSGFKKLPEIKKWSLHKLNSKKVLKKYTFHFLLSLIWLGFLLVFGSPFTPSIATLLRSQNTSETVQQANTPQPVNRLDVGGTDSGEIRQVVWQGALQVWKRYPLFGSGVETFGYSYYLDRPVAHNLVSEWDFLYNKAHNEFLNFLATTGVIGLGSYLFLLGSFGYFCIKNYTTQTRSDSEHMLTLSLLSGVVALSVTNFFGFSTVSVSVLLFVFFAAIVIISRDELLATDAKRVKNTTLQLWQKIALIGTTITCLFLLSKIHAYWKADVLYSQGSKYRESGQSENSILTLKKALELSPTKEADYYNELGQAYTQAALVAAQQKDATSAAELAQSAIQNTSHALLLNPEQLNFYKSHVQVLIRLSLLDPQLLHDAQAVLAAAHDRAPTDARIVYNLALIEEALGDNTESLAHLQQAVELKSNYIQARTKLGERYLADAQYSSAADQFRYILEFLAPGDTSTLDLLQQTEAVK